MNNIYKELFITFSKVGAFTLGGGYAMIPVLEKEVVDRKGWLNREEFMDILAVAQSCPGLFALNMSEYVAIKIARKNKKDIRDWVLALVASLGVALPSIVVILLIAMFFQAFKDNEWVEKFFMGVRPAVVALIIAPCFRMARTAKIKLHNLWIPVVSCVLIAAFGVSPIWIVIGTIALGFAKEKLLQK